MEKGTWISISQSSLMILLHLLDDKIDELVLEHCLTVEICDQKGDIVAL